MKLQDKFNIIDLHDKALFVWENGEYLSTREYYSMKVNLYALPGFLVEVFYSPYLNKIQRIEIVEDPKRLAKHLENIQIND